MFRSWGATYFKFFCPSSTKIFFGAWPKRYSLFLCLFVRLFVYLGFASRRDLYICVPAAHPPGGTWREDSFGEGRQRAGSGTGGPALQHTLPGEQQEDWAHSGELSLGVYLCVIVYHTVLDWIKVTLCHWDKGYSQQINETWRLTLAFG